VGSRSTGINAAEDGDIGEAAGCGCEGTFEGVELAAENGSTRG
jgi:hypothetical protein